MKTAAELRFGFWDVTARGDAALSTNDCQSFTHVADINGEDAVTQNVATLEPDFGWPLDGSRKLLPAGGGGEAWGWWSTALSGENGRFQRPPTLTVAFTQPHSSMGITLAFIATLPGLINVKWYALGGGVLADRDFYPDTLTYFCDCQIENYGKIVVTVFSMSAPHRYLRVGHLIFGALEVLAGEVLQSATLCEELDPSALTLPVSTLESSFCAPGGRFSLLDPSGAYRLFQRKQPIEVYETVEAQRQYLGVYYLNEAAGTVDSVTKLSCLDILGVLDGVEHKGGIYRACPVGVLLGELLTSEGIVYTLDPAFERETLTGHLPIGSKRAALQQIAFAIGAVVDATRKDGLALYPLPELTVQRIGSDRKIVGHSVRLEELVTQVDVAAHTYRLQEELRELSKTELEAGTHTLKFMSPGEVSGVTGGALLESGPNYAVIRVSSAGTVVVTGRQYVDDTTIFTAKSELLGAGERSRIKTVGGATLVDRARAPGAARRLYDYYQNRYTDEGAILPGSERVGAKTELASMGGRTLAGLMERMSIDLTGGYLANITMRGR